MLFASLDLVHLPGVGLGAPSHLLGCGDSSTRADVRPCTRVRTIPGTNSVWAEWIESRGEGLGVLAEKKLRVTQQCVLPAQKGKHKLGWIIYTRYWEEIPY